MRQVGVIAAPCAVALDSMIDRLADDHRRTREIAQGKFFKINENSRALFKKIFFQAIHDSDCGFITVDLEGLHTNILMLNFDTAKLTAGEFCTRMVEV